MNNEINDNIPARTSPGLTGDLRQSEILIEQDFKI
jgi:hypothetical protein